MIEVHCKYCGKTIGYYIEEDKKTLAILMKSKLEHEMHWCPDRHLIPKYMTSVEEVLDCLFKD